MELSRRLRLVLLTLTLAMLGACKSDGDEGSLLAGLQAVDRAEPTISGSPKTTVTVGETFVFTPRAKGTNGKGLTFTVSNKPKWSSFDSSTGTLRGVPRSSDVGIVRGLTIAVTNGRASDSIGPFDITVQESSEESAVSPPPDDSSANVPPMIQPTPDSRQAAGSAFQFSEIPEIVFVRGYAETEHLGIFHLDTLNRWRPGDLQNQAGWKPRVTTELDFVAGSLSGVQYDPDSGILSYDGSGSGSQTATVTLSAPSEGAVSQEFNVRVLEPTLVYGPDAERRFPAVGLDSSTTSWADMQKQLRGDAPYEDPNVLMLTAGTFADNFYIGSGKRNLYILGEPGSRPVFRGSHLPIANVETAYLKNLELWETYVDGGSSFTDRPVNIYITKVYQHDSVKNRNGFSTNSYEGSNPYGIVTPPGVWRHWFWNFTGSQMGGNGALNHHFYIQGRPNTYLIVNNMLITGSCECSVLKSTRYNNIVRNSLISSLLDPDKPLVGLRSDKLLDFASASEVVVYNNEFIGANSLEKGGLTAFIHFRARRHWWGADSPSYPDVSWSPARTSNYGGGYFAPEGFTAGPETFVNPAFWDTVSAYDLSDPQNPYTFKKYISYNTFRWVDEGHRRSPAIRDDGTAPRHAAYQFSNAEVWGTVPENWVERSVMFLANNSYSGWTAEDSEDPDRWINVTWSTPEDLVEKIGPGPWAYPTPPRTAVHLGGDMGPAATADPIELPIWFRK